MDKKEQFQYNVEKAVINIADFMILHSKDGVYVGRSKVVKEKLKLNTYVYNEAAGRLKAIGFMSNVKHFSKTQMKLRNDGEEYYYLVNSEKHPSTILNTSEAKVLLDKRRKKLDRKQREEASLMLDILTGKYDFMDEHVGDDD